MCIRYSVRQEPKCPPWRRRGWEVVGERGAGRAPTTTWHPTWELAMETANWLAHFGRGH